jgi:membrane-bound metal-dependent hydrolase YbcI (DUF457 family)
MPFTPFHMGPGMAVKALAGPRLSLVSFGAAQVTMDIEPLVHMMRGDRVHGFTHTYLGATVVGLATLAVARLLTRWLSGLWSDTLRTGGLGWLAEPNSGGWMPVFIGTFAGTYSHVFLDSIMHADMTPLAPFAEGNTLLHSLSYAGIHIVCVVSGILGLCAWVIVQRIRARRGDPSARSSWFSGNQGGD